MRVCQFIAGLGLLYLSTACATEKLQVVGPNDGLRIPAEELPILKRKAEHGDHEAAIKLASYYGLYLSDKKSELHYLKLGARNDSAVAVRNLMTVYSTDPDLFDFKEALRWRRRLKAMAQRQKVKIESDAEWGYDLYLDHLGDKDGGLFFLKYAADHGSAKARKELSEGK